MKVKNETYEQFKNKWSISIQQNQIYYLFYSTRSSSFVKIRHLHYPQCNLAAESYRCRQFFRLHAASSGARNSLTLLFSYMQKYSPRPVNTFYQLAFNHLLFCTSLFCLEAALCAVTSAEIATSLSSRQDKITFMLCRLPNTVCICQSQTFKRGSQTSRSKASFLWPVVSQRSWQVDGCVGRIVQRIAAGPGSGMTGWQPAARH